MAVQSWVPHSRRCRVHCSGVRVFCSKAWMCGSSSAKHSFTSLEERREWEMSGLASAGVMGSEASMTRKWGFEEGTEVQPQRQGHPGDYGSHFGALGVSRSHPGGRMQGQPSRARGLAGREAGSRGSPVSLEQWLSLELSRHHQDSEAGRATVQSRVLHLLAGRRHTGWGTRPRALLRRPRPPGIALTTCSASRSCRSFSRR